MQSMLIFLAYIISEKERSEEDDYFDLFKEYSRIIEFECSTIIQR